MRDQAEHLRDISARGENFYARAAAAKILAVTSGKGGVGKTNVAANLAIALQKEDGKVGLLDADFGLANVDVLLGLSPRHHLANLLFGDATLDDILLEGPEGITIIPATSGLERMVTLSDQEKEMLWAKLFPLLARLNWLVIDTAAGISPMVVDFVLKASEILLICTSEPTSLVDAYALVKVLEHRSPGRSIQLVVNAVNSESEAQNIYRQLNQVTTNFLKREIDFLGWVAFDEELPEAVRFQKAIMEIKPASPASRSYLRLARKLGKQFEEKAKAGGLADWRS